MGNLSGSDGPTQEQKEILEAFKESEEIFLNGGEDGSGSDFDPYSDKSDLSQEELKQEWELAERKGSLKTISHIKKSIDKIEKRITSGNEKFNDKSTLKYLKRELGIYSKNQRGRIMNIRNSI